MKKRVRARRNKMKVRAIRYLMVTMLTNSLLSLVAPMHYIHLSYLISNILYLHKKKAFKEGLL